MELVEVNDGITLPYIKTLSTSKSTGVLKFLMTASRSLEPFAMRLKCANRSHSIIDMTLLFLPQIVVCSS
jgi:hypothetical protein